MGKLDVRLDYPYQCGKQRNTHYHYTSQHIIVGNADTPLRHTPNVWEIFLDLHAWFLIHLPTTEVIRAIDATVFRWATTRRVIFDRREVQDNWRLDMPSLFYIYIGCSRSTSRMEIPWQGHNGSEWYFPYGNTESCTRCMSQEISTVPKQKEAKP